MAPSTTSKPETVTAKLSRLAAEVAKGGDLTEARRELMALAGGLPPGTRTHDKAAELVLRIDAAAKTEREKVVPLPVKTKPTRRAAAAKPKADPKPKAEKAPMFPEDIKDVPGVGNVSEEKDGTRYAMTAWNPAYHSGRSATGCSWPGGCDQTPVFSVLYQKPGKAVRALRALCDEHGRMMSKSHNLPLPKGVK